jgi:hypothetical protein
VSDPRASEKLPSDYVKQAGIEVAVAIAKSLLLGVRVPDEAYRADEALAEWRRELERRGL